MTIHPCSDRIGRTPACCLLLVGLTIAWLTALPAEGGKPPSYDSNAISMFTMNSATALARLRKGYFSLIYRGFGSRKAGQIEHDELLGFRFLLDTPIQSWGLRALIEKHEKSGLSSAAAWEKAKAEHTKLLQGFFQTFEDTRHLYENSRDKVKERVRAGTIDPEQHFVFTTPLLGIAKLYGPVVLVMRETRPRGMDLNSIAKDSRYYTLARLLRNIAEGQFRSVVADYFADRDEYVIPSYILPMDVIGLIVHDPSPMVIAGRIAVPPPAIRRVYRKNRTGGQTVIEVYDGQDRLVARLSPGPGGENIYPADVRSPEKLPKAIEACWQDHLKSIRQKK